MMRYLLELILFASVATSYNLPPLAAVSWGPNRGDVFGVSDKGIFHKFYDGKNWQPDSVEYLVAKPPYYPVATSWGPDRLDVFYSSDESELMHLFWDGSSWQPSGEPYAENLGPFLPPGAQLAATCWGENRMDVFGRVKGNCFHTYWDGTEWNGTFLGYLCKSAIAATSWGENRLDLFMIDYKSNMRHKYWDGSQWNPPNLDWEKMGDGKYIGDPVATSWGEGRFDVWAIDEDSHELRHIYWNVDHYSEWESLGGYFDYTPQVTHRKPGVIDIIGLGSDGEEPYGYKNYDGNQWNPDVKGWYGVDGTLVTRPAILSWSEETLALVGLTEDDELAWRYYWGDGWFPEDGSWSTLAKLQSPSLSSEKDFKLVVQDL